MAIWHHWSGEKGGEKFEWGKKKRLPLSHPIFQICRFENFGNFEKNVRDLYIIIIVPELVRWGGSIRNCIVD